MLEVSNEHPFNINIHFSSVGVLTATSTIGIHTICKTIPVHTSASYDLS